MGLAFGFLQGFGADSVARLRALRAMADPERNNNPHEAAVAARLADEMEQRMAAARRPQAAPPPPPPPPPPSGGRYWHAQWRPGELLGHVSRTETPIYVGVQDQHTTMYRYHQQEAEYLGIPRIGAGPERAQLRKAHQDAAKAHKDVLRNPASLHSATLAKIAWDSSAIAGFSLDHPDAPSSRYWDL